MGGPVIKQCQLNAIRTLQAYVYVLYPMSAVAFCASIYMTLAVTVERYIAVCKPHQYRAITTVSIIRGALKIGFRKKLGIWPDQRTPPPRKLGRQKKKK